jgi:hypothetical protein
MRGWLVLTLCIPALLAVGCGGKQAATITSTAAATASPAAARTARMKAVVRAWSTHLDTGDNVGAARLFALPALVIQAPYEYLMRTRAELVFWNHSLPCAGHIVSITVHGSRATAVFRLANRPSSKCDAPGQLAAAVFTFARGKIVRWEQVSVPATASPPSA